MILSNTEVLANLSVVQLVLPEINSRSQVYLKLLTFSKSSWAPRLATRTVIRTRGFSFCCSGLPFCVRSGFRGWVSGGISVCVGFTLVRGTRTRSGLIAARSLLETCNSKFNCVLMDCLLATFRTILDFINKISNKRTSYQDINWKARFPSQEH